MKLDDIKKEIIKLEVNQIDHLGNWCKNYLIWRELNYDMEKY